MPPLTIEIGATVPTRYRSFYEQNGGKPFPAEHFKKAVKEIDEFCKILEHEGVNVRRPKILDHSKVMFEGLDFITWYIS